MRTAFIAILTALLFAGVIATIPGVSAVQDPPATWTLDLKGDGSYECKECGDDGLSAIQTGDSLSISIDDNLYRFAVFSEFSHFSLPVVDDAQLSDVIYDNYTDRIETITASNRDAEYKNRGIHSPPFLFTGVDTDDILISWIGYGSTIWWHIESRENQNNGFDLIYHNSTDPEFTTPTQPGLANNLPVFNDFASQRLEVGNVSQPDTLSVSVTATDADPGDTITYSIDSVTGGNSDDGNFVDPVIDSSTGLVTWAPTDNDHGVYTVTVRASDGTGFATAELIITVVYVPDSDPVTVPCLSQDPILTDDAQRPNLQTVINYTRQVANSTDYSAIDGNFIGCEIYPFVFDGDGLIVAHGTIIDNIDTLDIDTLNSTSSADLFAAMPNDGDTVWWEYEYLNPLTDQTLQKRSLLYNDGGYAIGAGYYIPTGITFSESFPLIVTEASGIGNSATYDVSLVSNPGSNVTVSLSGFNEEDITVSPVQLVFGQNNGTLPQTVTVTGIDDDVDNNPDRMATITHTPAGRGYNMADARNVTVTITDDDTAGIITSPMNLLLTANQNNSLTGTYTVKLSSKPTDQVTVSVTHDSSGAISVSPDLLTFDGNTWNNTQSISVNGTADNGDDCFTISHDASGGGYDSVSTSKVEVALEEDAGCPTDPLPRKRSGDDNDWQKKPTFGKSWEVSSYQLVENGFSFNGHTVDIVNNWHTDFPMTSSVIGDTNTVHIKSHAADGFKWIKLYLGVPDRGKSSEAESSITLHLQRNHTSSPAGYDITEIVHEQKEPLINVEGTSAMVEEVMCNDTSETVCYEFDIMFTVDAPLSHDVLALEAVDTKRRVTVTYLNEGVQFDGESLLDPATARIFSKLANQDEGVYIELTKQDRRYDVWVDDDGYLYYENRYGTFERVTQPDFERYADEPDSVMTRLHSEFGKVIQYEQERAKLVWDSSAIASELEDSYSIVTAKKHQRMNQELLTEMEMQELLAQERSQNKLIYNWGW